MTTMHQPRQHPHPAWLRMLRMLPPLLVALGVAFFVLMFVG